MKKILFTAIILAAAWGCTREAFETGPVALEMVQAQLGIRQDAAVSRADADIDPADPTMSPIAARTEHAMTITIGGTSGNYAYTAMGWTPVDNPVRFAGSSAQTVDITLSKAGATQDGTARGLVDADALVWSNPTQTPAKILSGVEMTHARVLIQLELDAAAPAATNVTVNDIPTYNVPGTKAYQAIVDAGVASLDLSMTINGQECLGTVDKSASQTSGEFLANNRYTVPVSYNAGKLELKPLGVELWTVAGSTTAGPAGAMTVFEFEGDLSGFNKMLIRFADNSTVDGLMLQDDKSKVFFPLTGADKMIAAVELFHDQDPAGQPLPVGRPEGSTVRLRVDASCDLGFRTASGNRLINTIAEFSLLASDVGNYASNYLQECDIYFMGRTTDRPVGTYASRFSGTYDGAGYSIRNAVIVDNGGVGKTGLFGCNGATGVIKNVRIAASCSVPAPGDNRPVAALCGQNFGTIENCHNAAAVTAPNCDLVGGIAGDCSGGTVTGCTNSGAVEGLNRIGGICGFATAAIASCINSGTVEGLTYVGGVCGDSQSNITSCENSGDVTATNTTDDSYAGGIAGYLFSGTILTCANGGAVTGLHIVGGISGGSQGVIRQCENLTTGAVEGAGVNIGGVCGSNSGASAKVENCTNAATVKSTATSEDRLGGICGENINSATVTGCGNTGEVTGAGTNIGGVCGANAATVGTCTNSAKVVAIKAGGDYNSLGGICGWNTGTGTLTACANTGEITGAGTNIGGVCGYNSGTAENCTNAATVKATHANAENNLGGVCGVNDGGTVTACSNLAAGAVEGAGTNIGGVCGQNSGLAAKVEACSNAGNVASTYIGGDNSLGGVCGWNFVGTITACRNTGNVTGAGTNIGGVCGYLSYNGSITACYTTGKVTGLVDVHHLALIDPDHTGTIQYCYWVVHTGTGTPTTASNETVNGCFEFSATRWPGNGATTAAFNAANGWGEYTGNGTTPPASGSGLYWKSLGSWNGGVGTTYPKLWWE